MKIGVFEFVIDQSADPAVLAKRAEELGFYSFWAPEHLIIERITDQRRGRIPWPLL